jgi:dihydrofolate reductase
MTLALIAAVARNRVIGQNGSLPWRIPEDLRRFKQLTIGHAVLMGRRTYESIGRPLPDRRNVVLSSRPVQGVEHYQTFEEALEALRNEPIVFVIGGASLYTRLLESADELYLTLVDQSPEGDTVFPPYEHLLGTRFTLVLREKHEGFEFLDYKRSSSSNLS